jgi:hypothetical protein
MIISFLVMCGRKSRAQQDRQADAVEQHARTAKAHQRQGQALGGQQAQVHAHVDEGLHADPDADAFGGQAGEHLFQRDRLAADVEGALDEPVEHRHHDQHANQAQFFADDGHDEVGVRFGQVEQFLDRATQTHAKDLAASERDQRVRQLVRLVQGVALFPRVQVGEHARPAEWRKRDDRTEDHDQQSADAAEPDDVDPAQEQDAHGDADDHAERAQIRLHQQQAAHQADGHDHRHEALGQLVHVLLLADREVSRVKHHGNLHDFGRLHHEHLQREPAACAVDRHTQARNQHQHQQHQRADEDHRRMPLPDRDRHAEHDGGGHHRDEDVDRLAVQEVFVAVLQIAEFRRIRQRNRRRVHHHHPEQHQEQRDPDQRLVVVHHFGRPAAPVDSGVDGVAGKLEGQLEGHQISCP